MNVLTDFVKNALRKKASFDLHQLSAIYLKNKILIFYIHFVFVHCTEWGSFAWFSSIVFVFVSRLCRSFRRFAQGSAETVHFPGDFLAGKMGEFFCNLCSGCHYLLYFISLFIYYYYYFIFFLVGVN